MSSGEEEREDRDDLELSEEYEDDLRRRPRPRPLDRLRDLELSEDDLEDDLELPSDE